MTQIGGTKDMDLHFYDLEDKSLSFCCRDFHYNPLLFLLFVPCTSLFCCSQAHVFLAWRLDS